MEGTAMANLSALWDQIHSTIINSPRQVPSTITIPRDHVDENLKNELDWDFKKDQHYFQVMINEMFLANAREWFTQIDPLVYVVSEFVYNGKDELVPYVVGPGMIKKLGIQDDDKRGILLRNTNASGLRPYRGKGLTLTIVLCQSNKNLLRPLLDVIESVSGALDFSPVLSPYTKIANVLMDGLDALFKSDGVTPLVGLRDSFGPNQNIPFRPGYYALIDAPDVDPKTLYVKKRQLHQGDSMDSSKPFRDADFVLYSFSSPQSNSRDDTTTLPINEMWERVKKEAATPIDDPDYKNAKILMVNLYQNIVLSPDLTEPQADALSEEWKNKMKAIHERAVSIGAMGVDEDISEKPRREAARNKALEILDL
jgi:hypothetical protein